MRRDREHQIINIEEERHRHREKEHGKNYLLETYLNGLHDFAGTTTTTTSSCSGGGGDGFVATPDDSGVHTEDAASSSSQPTTTPIEQQAVDAVVSVCAAAATTSNYASNEPPTLSLASVTAADDVDEHAIADEIEWFQKICAINKQLQREEERWVRLARSLHKYETKDAADKIQSPVAMNAELVRLAVHIDGRTTEIDRIQREIDVTGELMHLKSDVLARLSTELQQLEMAESGGCGGASNEVNVPNSTCQQQSTLLYTSVGAAAATNVQHMMHHHHHRQDPMYWQKNDCEIASKNLLPGNHSKVGPKKLQLHSFQAKDPDSDTGLSSLGDDSVLLMGTLV